MITINDLGGVQALVNLAVFLMVGTLGAWSHYLKRWVRGQITGHLWAYLFHDNIRGTVLATMTFFGAAMTAYLSGQLDEVALRTLVSMAFMAGYVCDSALNDGDRS